MPRSAPTLGDGHDFLNPRHPRGGAPIGDHRGGGSPCAPEESWPFMFDTLITAGITAEGSDRAGGRLLRAGHRRRDGADPEPTLLLVADRNPNVLRTRGPRAVR